MNININTQIKLNKQLNQRFYRLEKAKDINEKSSAAYYYAQKETDKEKPRYTTSRAKLEAMSENELREMHEQVNVKLRSKTSTKKGLQEQYENAMNAGLEAIQDELNITITQDEWQEFLNNGGGELLNQSPDSWQVIESWQKWKGLGISTKQFKHRIKQSINSKAGYDIGKVNRTFIKLTGKTFKDLQNK